MQEKSNRLSIIFYSRYPIIRKTAHNCYRRLTLYCINTMETGSKTLIYASNSYSGMGPYVVSIVNSFHKDDNVRFYLIENKKDYYSKNIKKELLPNCRIIYVKIPSKLYSLGDIFFGFKASYLKDLKEYCKKENISIVHSVASLANDSVMSFFSHNYKFLCTVHDLHPHEARKAFYKKVSQKCLYKRVFRSFVSAQYLYTNSLSQLEEAKQLYPDKRCYYTPFPTLITESVKYGNNDVPELKDIRNYFLFFGRIEEYKGLRTLVQAFERCNFTSQIKLVIAGNGDFKIGANNENIIFINRYIDDTEIKKLYENACCVVYPYISATQSGVLSLASYFGTPIIASSVPFFEEILGKKYPYLFEPGNSDELACKMKDMLSTLTQMRSFSNELYKEKYCGDKLRSSLLRIYESIVRSVESN